MATTENFNWPTPNDTDFVKFGAAAIRALGDAIDTTVEDIDNRVLTALDIYPVGAIYMSVVNTNPSVLFGGTWVAFGQGQVVVGVSPADADFDAAEKTGGAKTHTLSVAEMPQHTHTQNQHTHTQAQHTHSQNSHFHDLHYRGTLGNQGAQGGRIFGDANLGGSTGHFIVPASFSNLPNTVRSAIAVANPARAIGNTATNNFTTATNNFTTPTNNNTGGGGAHNNLQPYVTAYMFKRTA